MKRQNWEEVKLTNIAEIIMGQSPKSEFYNEDGIGLPFYQGITEFGELYPEVRKYCTIKKRIAEKGDILMTVRAPVGALNIATERCIIGRGLCAIRSKEAIGRYLFYLLKVNEEYIRTYGSGTVYKSITKDSVHNLKFIVPNLEIQRKISNILSLYDDLIENNHRKIKLLEEIAQLIYHEWFVKYRYPGHEKVPLIDLGTDFGLIPEGWELTSMNNAVEIQGGGTPSTKVVEYWDDGDINWFSPSDLTSKNKLFLYSSLKQITKLGLKKSSAKLFPPYSVMMTSRATVGVVAVNTQNSCTNQGFITCIPNERVPFNYLIFWIRYNLKKILRYASGATFKEINKTTFRNMEILLPKASIMKQFKEFTTPLFKQIEIVERSIDNLQETRDLLLPKLISGQIDISNMDIAIDEEEKDV